MKVLKVYLLFPPPDQLFIYIATLQQQSCHRPLTLDTGSKMQIELGRVELTYFLPHLNLIYPEHTRSVNMSNDINARDNTTDSHQFLRNLYTPRNFQV